MAEAGAEPLPAVSRNGAPWLAISGDPRDCHATPTRHPPVVHRLFSGQPASYPPETHWTLPGLPRAPTRPSSGSCGHQRLLGQGVARRRAGTSALSSPPPLTEPPSWALRVRIQALPRCLCRPARLQSHTGPSSLSPVSPLLHGVAATQVPLRSDRCGRRPAARHHGHQKSPHGGGRGVRVPGDFEVESPEIGAKATLAP